MKSSDIFSGLCSSVVGLVSGVIKLPIAIATEVVSEVKKSLPKNDNEQSTSEDKSSKN